MVPKAMQKLKPSRHGLPLWWNPEEPDLPVLSHFGCPNVIIACLWWEVLLISVKKSFPGGQEWKVSDAGAGWTHVCLSAAHRTSLPLCARWGKASQSQHRGTEPFPMHCSGAGGSHLLAASVTADIWRPLMRLGQITVNYNYKSLPWWIPLNLTGPKLAHSLGQVATISPSAAPLLH